MKHALKNLFKNFMLANCLLITNYSFAQFNGGTGTIADPYQISNVTQLQAMNTGLDKHFILTQNIDASITSTWNAGAGFEPIGLTSATAFTGTFDGKGYVISKLYIDRPSNSGVGLFGNAFTLTTGVVSIQNVGLDSVYVKGGTRVGALIGSKDLIIRNCYASGTVVGTGDNTGGLVGRNGLSELSNSHSSCIVNGVFNTGGLVGSGGNIRNCYATGNVTGTGSVGGLIGGISSIGGLVYKSYATGNVSTTNNNIIGGLIGRMQNGLVDLCYATGTLNSTKAAGLIYQADAGTIKRSFSSSKIAPTTNELNVVLAGFVGENKATIRDCYSISEITYSPNNLSANLSGFVSFNRDKGKIYDCYTATKINANSAGIAAFAGTNEVSNTNIDTGYIKNCYFNIDTAGTYPSIRIDQGGAVAITSLTDVLMRKQSSFALWNFDTTWNILENQTFPFHRLPIAPCVNTTAIDSVRACKSYTWINGITYTMNTDTASFIIPNSAGCDSIINLKLIIDTINVDVSVNANVLVASQAAIGTTYQWINCDTNTPIANATNKTYSATTTGNYAVIVSNNSCVDTSACINVVVLGIEKLNSNEIKIYPNPSSSVINFKLIKTSEVKIIDALGRVIYSSNLEAGDQTLNITDFDNGVYVLCIRNEENYFVSKFIMQQ